MHAARRITAAALALAAGLALTACASLDDTLGDAADAGVAALGSSAIATELHGEGALVAPTADTVLSDAVTELTDASRTVLELTPTDPDAEARRDAVEGALRDALDAVVGARAALARGDGLDAWTGRLHDARDRLEAASS
ncbi:MAG: hypothetical protein DI534_14255 [Leifsonia xyli]|nr:MAG: hypothetical protein DI534_14255 [Leifsonia xyli]